MAPVAPPGVPYLIRVPGSPSVASPSRLSEAVSARGRQQRLNRSTSDLGMLGHTLVYESRADHHGSLERRLNGHRHAPSLSLYKRENTEMEALAHVLRDASRTRAECGHAMSLDGDATQRRWRQLVRRHHLKPKFVSSLHLHLDKGATRVLPRGSEARVVNQGEAVGIAFARRQDRDTVDSAWHISKETRRFTEGSSALTRRDRHVPGRLSDRRRPRALLPTAEARHT